MKKIKKFGYWIIRLAHWIISGFGYGGILLNVPNGTDYLPFLSPYSLGGMERQKFLKLYHLKRLSTEKEHNQAMYECDTYARVERSIFLRKYTRSQYSHRYFLSPWKKDYQYNR